MKESRKSKLASAMNNANLAALKYAAELSAALERYDNNHSDEFNVHLEQYRIQHCKKMLEIISRKYGIKLPEIYYDRMAV